MAYNALNNLIDAYIYANGVQAITGQILNGVLKAMVSQLGGGYNLMGVATPASSPAVNDEPLAYFAATAGTYTNFDGIVLAAGEVAILLTSGNGSWSKQTIYNVPTGTADLENTANFITNSVNTLVNYYTKAEINTKKAETDAALDARYTKTETDTKLAEYYKKTETYDKDEVDSIIATLYRQEYIVAWDGLATPDVSAIPAGVTVTYSGTPYTGTLAASDSTLNKIYMVWNGTAYDMYGTSQDGGYSWVPMGTTSVDLSQYATKAELGQLQQEVTDLFTPTRADFEISDEEYNSIAVFKDGHIKTKNFYSAEAPTSEAVGPLYDFAITDENGDAAIAVKDGYPKTKNFDGEEIAQGISETEETLSNIEQAIEGTSLYATTVVNIADYNNNLMDVFNAISPSEKHHYTILIPEGTYNVESWFTPAEIEGSEQTHFRGVELPNYIKLLGVGCADKVVLKWDNETYQHLGYISTLNTHEWHELENLTVIGRNIRYAVHDDIWNGEDRYLRVKNCSFIVGGSTTRAWGAGCNGGYDAVFENCKFIMEEAVIPPGGRYVEPFVLHDNYYNTRGDSHLAFLNCRFITPYTDYHQPLDHNSWESITYDSDYPEYDPDKKDYAVNDCVNMPGDTSASYRCLYANTQVMPYGEGRPSINIGFGAEGATQPLYVTLTGCYLSTYMAVSPNLTRATGFGNKSGKTPIAILWDESADDYSTIINII